MAFKEDQEWKNDKFDTFVMKTSHKDKFEKGSQVIILFRYIFVMEEIQTVKCSLSME